MAKGQSPLLGYNTNVRHKGRVFHIQTEDSGVAHPHVITHLFADGGRILKSTKTPYADLLDAPDLQPQVKKIMQDQHKAMFIALRDGQFDHLIDPGGAAPARESGTPTGAHAAPSPAPSADATVRTPALSAAPAPITAPAPATQPSAPAAPVRAPSTAGMSAVPPPSAPSSQQTGVRPVVPPPPAPPPARPAAAPAARPSVPMPAVSAPAATPSSTPAQAASAPSATPSPPQGTGKYAPVRSPEILGSFKPRPETGSIFGDGMMSEKSLDEVILAYLAEDLDESKKR